MANRILRDWTNSEKIDNLSLLAEVVFVRLIMRADDFGCFYGNPKLLSSHLFPLKDIQVDKISKALAELIKNNIIIHYQHEGRLYIQIINFSQRLRAMHSKFPLPNINNMTIDSEAQTIDSEAQTIDSEAQTIDSEAPPETKRSRNEVEDEKEVGETPKTPLELKFDEFIIFRRKKKNPILPESLDAFKKKLWLLSGQNIENAIKILDESIAQGWTGIFKLKENKNGKSIIENNKSVREAVFAKHFDNLNKRYNPESSEN